jgi:hypothetical protein
VTADRPEQTESRPSAGATAERAAVEAHARQLAPATAQKECQIAAQFFRHAFRKGLIERNPFEGVTVGKATNLPPGWDSPC